MSSSAAVLVAHGSADRRAAATTRALARLVAAARPGLAVRPAFLDHAGPRPGPVLAGLAGAGHHRATLVPLLLTSAYHHRVDLPAVLAEARAAGLRLPVAVAGVLGPASTGPVPAPLLAALRTRLAGHRAGFDAVVLAAAGTRDPAARASVAAVAAGLGEALGVQCRAGYASAAPTVGAAVGSFRSAGRRRVAVAAYFLASGRLYEVAAAAARAAGAVAVADPLGADPELAQLVLARLDAAAGAPAPALTGGLR